MAIDSEYGGSASDEPNPVVVAEYYKTHTSRLAGYWRAKFSLISQMNLRYLSVNITMCCSPLGFYRMVDLVLCNKLFLQHFQKNPVESAKLSRGNPDHIVISDEYPMSELDQQQLDAIDLRIPSICSKAEYKVVNRLGFGCLSCKVSKIDGKVTYHSCTHEHKQEE